tara:strand:+ start:1297 stop:1803 length:507 start_codon:yes stop_codon:yes gene_type:complete
MTRYTFMGLNMPQMTAAIGYLLIALGSVFWIFTGYITALIPALFGGLMVFSALGSRMKPEKNAVFMHIAVLASLSATVLGVATVAINPQWSTSTAAVEQLLMTVLSGVHFGVSMASFTYGAPTDAEADRRCGHDGSQWAIPASNNTVNYPSANESSMAATILLTSPRK